ncbi:acyl-coenzyme A thioesterase 1-like [Salarias fasciatus]|uniref:acyl-coenzyme A thioesterase 1-like n=1 Tax=Salarias fasciatus TaxID=181472 RepID=UPI001176E935|nr:acyl-coenzyme A thioesterase 1-like [Salarias fasciatus]
MSSQVRLQLLPRARCLFDEPIQVKVSGLKSYQVVTMKARSTDERGRLFKSSAVYRADESGEIDLNRDPSLSGSYIGVEPMGLLWSLSPETLHKLFTKLKALIPHVVKISVHEEGEEGQMLAEVTNERFLIADGVSRVPVSEGNIQGILFTPPGEGPFPAVLDLCTFMSETRACLLANKGFMALAVAVFHDKPCNVKELHLDPHQEAVDFLLKQPKVGSKGVGVLSRSKAGDVALALGAFVPGVEAIKAIPTESGASIIKHIIEDPLAEENKGSLVPVQKVEGRLLFVASGDDMNWDSKGYMDEMVERLKHHGKNNFETVYYTLAGHLLEPPYYPFCPSSFHIMTPYPVLWGGEPKAHITAEMDLHEKIQEFFKTHLSCDPDESTAKF